MSIKAAAEEWGGANLPWNFAMGVVDAVFISLGLHLVSRETVMPLLVSHLTSSRMAVGLIGAVYSLGYYLPQLFAASLAERLSYKKPFVMLLGGLGERLPYLLIGLTLWRLAGASPAVALVLFYLLLGISATSNGMATPAWFDMIAKVIPVGMRGVYSGVGRALGALFGVGGAMLAGQILAARPFPHGFALCFALSSVAMAISWSGLALTREPASLVTKPHTRLSHYLSQLPLLLRRDRNYARFLVGRAVVLLGTMAASFFMVYGVSRFALGGRGVGMLTAVLVGSQAVLNLLWGMVGDRRGHKSVLSAAAIIMALAAATALLSSSANGLILVFALIGIAMAGDSVSGMNIILEFCHPEDRATYIGLTSTLLAPVRIVAPLLGGLLATALGYPGLFAVAAIASVLGGLWLALEVREPRYDPERDPSPAR